MNVPITPDMQASMILTNLTKTSTPDNSSLAVTSSPPSFQTNGVWNQAKGSLSVRITSAIAIGGVYVLSFVLSNPLVGQQSPAISISFQGVDTSTGAQVVIIPSFAVDHADGNSNPLVIGFFSLAYVEQQTPSATLSNQITMAFSTNVGLAVHSTISLFNLVGSMKEMGVIRGMSSASSMLNQVTLDSSASSVDNAYLGFAINIQGSFSNITQYSGTTKTATLAPPMTATPSINKDYYYIATNSTQSIPISCDGLTGCDYGLTSGYLDMVMFKTTPARLKFSALSPVLCRRRASSPWFLALRQWPTLRTRSRSR